jgi:hypothetical protein
MLAYLFDSQTGDENGTMPIFATTKAMAIVASGAYK